MSLAVCGCECVFVCACACACAFALCVCVRARDPLDAPLASEAPKFCLVMGMWPCDLLVRRGQLRAFLRVLRCPPDAPVREALGAMAALMETRSDA